MLHTHTQTQPPTSHWRNEQNTMKKKKEEEALPPKLYSLENYVCMQVDCLLHLLCVNEWRDVLHWGKKRNAIDDDVDDDDDEDGGRKQA